MIDIISAIALLCQVDPGGSAYTIMYVDRYQLRCQQEYVRCVQTESPAALSADAVFKCILNRKVNK